MNSYGPISTIQQGCCIRLGILSYLMLFQRHKSIFAVAEVEIRPEDIRHSIGYIRAFRFLCRGLPWFEFVVS